VYSLSGNTSRFSQRLIQEWDFCLIPVRTPLCKISSTGEIEQRFRLN